GHPVLVDLVRWRRQVEALGLEGAVARADGLSTGLVEDAARRWRASATASDSPRDAAAAFRRLSRATDFDLEAFVREADPRAPAPLAAERPRLRQALLTALAAQPGAEEEREAWTMDLLDRSDLVLTAVDDVKPETAAAQIALVADDVAWYLEHVETKRGRRRTRLAIKLRRLRGERQERALQARLEGIFGARALRRWSRLIFALIFFVLGLLAAEIFFDIPPRILGWMRVADTLSCLVFLWDFFFRLRLVEGRLRWFLRHFLVDFIPSLPVAVFTVGASGADPLRVGRAIRLFRLPRVVGILRAVGFLVRGTDRMVRRYGHLLNRDIILYPTRAESERARRRDRGIAARARRIESELNDLWEDLLLSVPPAERGTVALRRIEAMEEARRLGVAHRRGDGVADAAADREIPAELLVRRLEDTTAEGLEANQGPEFVARTARAIRAFARRPLCWVPFLRGYVPRLGVRMTDAEVTAAGARQVATCLRRQLDRWFFFADLYGTVTPAEFVDRVGGALFKSAFRPTYRLLLFGAGFLLVDLLLAITPSPFLREVAKTLGEIVGTTLLVLGGVGGAVLMLGWWLQRVADEATAFYEQTVAAQFLPLMESVKGRFLDRDAFLLDRRVLGPETLLHGEAPGRRAASRQRRFVEGIKAWLVEAQPQGDARGSFDAMERTLLLYRDAMDGALFDVSDTRTTNQLLGNPALRQLHRTAWCVNRRERKALQALDLSQRRRWFGGPYMWFSLITHAIAHGTARLIVEYNREAIPLDELAAASPQARTRREAWLASAGGSEEDAKEREVTALDRQEYFTMAFTALHFLDDDPRRDREVAGRFGAPVLARLRRDRRFLFRRIFGTYPLYDRPLEERVVNLYELYEARLAGGRAIFLPLRGLWGSLKWIGRVVRWVAAAVKEIRDPRTAREIREGTDADFAVAVRKIDRMRGPVVRACLWLRVRVDCEYLGVRLPDVEISGVEGRTVNQDLEFLDVPASLRRRVAEERDLAQADVRRLARLIDDRLLDRVAGRLGATSGRIGREARRALAFVYRADILGVRSLLSASDVLRETAIRAAQEPLQPGRLLPPAHLWAPFRRWWKAHGEGGRAERKAAWRAVLNDVNGARRALEILRRFDEASARDEGERRVAELLRHPGRLSGQLVTLRAVQTLSLIDVLNYRTHVWRLGRYEEDGEDAGCLVCVDPVG
ncbi:MAG: hypothetical protein ACC662_04775, partial [Planctomycetota bacterium]